MFEAIGAGDTCNWTISISVAPWRIVATHNGSDNGSDNGLSGSSRTGCSDSDGDCAQGIESAELDSKIYSTHQPRRAREEKELRQQEQPLHC